MIKKGIKSIAKSATPKTPKGVLGAYFGMQVPKAVNPGRISRRLMKTDLAKPGAMITKVNLAKKKASGFKTY